MVGQADPDQPIGALIGIGRTAEVFERPDGTVLKLLRPGFETLGAAECVTADWLARSKVPAPRLLAQVDVSGRVGLVFEHVDGMSMQDRLVRRPWELYSQAARLASLHAEIHATSGAGLRPQREVLVELIESGAEYLPADGRDRALRRLSELPDGQSLCHGDFHPGNVRLSARGPIAVDWIAASCGDPAGDIARTTFLLRYALVPRASHRFRQALVTAGLHRLLGAYLRHYRRLRPVAPSDIEAWWLVVLASRMAKRDEQERPLLTRLIRHELTRSS
jgi:aminoglycoside phosphotransferase (APT) family kinase protein